MGKKKKSMVDILATHDEVNRFSINHYHNDGKGFPISRFKLRSNSRRIIGVIFLVIGVIILAIGFNRNIVLYMILGAGMLWIAWENLRYRTRPKK